MRVLPSPATFSALRATHAAHRLATAILHERVTTLATVECEGCRRRLAVATDPAHPRAPSETRVICPACQRAPRLKQELAWGLDDAPEPPLEVCMEDIEQWLREGLFSQLSGMSGVRWAVNPQLIGDLLGTRFDGRSYVFGRADDGSVTILAAAANEALAAASEEIVVARVPRAGTTDAVTPPLRRAARTS